MKYVFEAYDFQKKINLSKIEPKPVTDGRETGDNFARRLKDGSCMPRPGRHFARHKVCRSRVFSGETVRRIEYRFARRIEYTKISYVVLCSDV